MKKRFISVVLMFLIVMSTITFAADEAVDNRAGMSWWDRTEALTGN